MEGMIIQHPAGRITLEVWRPSFHPRSFWVEHGEHFKRRAWLPIDSWVEPSELHIQEYIYVHQQDSATSLNNVTGTSYPPSNMIFLLLTARVSPFDKETAAAKQVFRFLHRAGTDTIMEIASRCREHVPRKGALYVTLWRTTYVFWGETCIGQGTRGSLIGTTPIHWIDCNLKISVEVKSSVNLFASRKQTLVNGCGT